MSAMKVYVYLIAVFFLSMTALSAQQVGDYKSIASGNWSNTGIWETYNGTNWVAASVYPGQLTGTNNVSIIGGNSVSISSTIANSINSVNIGDGMGAVDNFYVSGTSSLNTALIIISNGGAIEWISNVSLSLPAAASLKIEDGGVLVVDKPCNAAKRLIIGSTIYSTCNGAAGAQYSFTDLNDEGGTLAVSPTSNTPICEGELLNLFANPSGTGSSSASYLWTGSNGDTFTNENPIISGLAQGNYTYTVTIRDSAGNTNTKSLIVAVLEAPSLISITSGSRNGPGPVLLAASTSSGVLNWFSNSSGGSILGTGSSFTTPALTTTTTFYVQVTGGNGCISTRVPVLATINIISNVISNKNITYRVKIN